MNLKCPKCNSENIHTDKKGFSGKKAVAGAVITGGIGLLAGTIGSNSIVCTCVDCGYKYKAGQYSQEKAKFDKEKKFNERVSKGQESYGGAIFLFIVFSIIGCLISYKLWVNDWNFLGFLFSVATLFCIAMLGFTIYSEVNRKNVEQHKSNKTEIDDFVEVDIYFLDREEHYPFMSRSTIDKLQNAKQRGVHSIKIRASEYNKIHSSQIK